MGSSLPNSTTTSDNERYVRLRPKTGGGALGGCPTQRDTRTLRTLIIHREHLTIETRGRGTYELTRQVQQAVERSKIVRGLCHLFIHHTSASLIVCENADSTVRRDLEQFAANLVPDGDPSLMIPVESRRCDLGTWQGLFLWEHRTRPHRRRITISVTGDEHASAQMT